MRNRANIIFGIFLILFSLVGIKLFIIQVLNHGQYKVLAEDQYWESQELPPKRGTIYSSDQYVLAGTQIYYLLYAEPNRIENKYEAAHNIAEVFAEIYAQRKLLEANTIESSTSASEKEISKENENNPKSLFEDLYKKYYDLLSTDLLWVALERNINPQEKEIILNKKLKGVGFEEQPVRFYPEDNLGAHLLGFVAHNDKGEAQGYYGIEGIFNEDLKGRSGRITEETDALGRPILTGGYRKVPPIEGRDIVLTINRSIQYSVEKKLKEGVEKYDASSGTVIVMDPYTSEIIAMANYPSYYPNNVSFDEEVLSEENHRLKSDRVNSAISRTYEPGSVMKPLTVSAAIDLKLVSPETTFEDNGPVTYSGHVIDNWDKKHHNTQTVTELLQKSNNIGAAWVGTKVGSKNLHKYLKDFGIGSKTGLELEGEDTGYISDFHIWTDIDLATISFGQGMSATPLQVLNYFNVIANGGYMMRPKVVSKILDKNEEISIPPKNLGRVISKSTAQTMDTMLEKAVSGGEAKFFVTKEYMVSGKTGTAQIPDKGKYDPSKTNATFVGYLTNSKKFSMIVKLQEPRASIYAAETAVPLWMEIAEYLVKYYGILPDKKPSEN